MEDMALLLENCTDKYERFKILCTLTKKKLYSHELKEAKLYAESARALCSQLNDEKYEALLDSLLGSIEHWVMNYDKSLELFYKAYPVFKKHQMNREMTECLNNISAIYGKMNDLDNAYKTLMLALELNPQSPSVLSNIGLIHFKNKEHAKALDYYLQAYPFFPKEPNVSAYIYFLTNLAECYLYNQKIDESLDTLKEAEKVSLENNNIEQYTIQMHFGVHYEHLERFKEAEPYFLKAKEIAEQKQIPEYVMEMEYVLSDLYFKLGEYKKAYEYLHRFQEIYREVFNNRFSNEIAKLRTQFDLEKQEIENHKLLEQTAKLSSIGVMAAGITHEINQPLCAIKVNADSVLYWLKKKLIELPEHFCDNITQISYAADRIDQIIQHIRSFWTISEERKVQEISLNDTIKQALQLIEKQIYSHGIFLELDLCEAETFIQAEQIPIEEVLINLVVNAIHSLDESEVENKNIKIKTQKTNQDIILTIADNGKGISPEIGNKIFDPFYTKKTSSKGMGLGLAIVKLYTEQYNASVQYANNSDSGVTFTITFKGCAK
ncbi:MAG TPA: ATP-binding protein [Candidatus Cloacimonadota bacterium]|nr:ATP-binding protein [Candidatus Cloacimonadota bacterium]